MEAHGTSGGLCLAWKDAIRITLKSFSNNYIDVLVQGKDGDVDWRFTRFYGSSFMSNKNDSWDTVKSLGKECHPLASL